MILSSSCADCSAPLPATDADTRGDSGLVEDAEEADATAEADADVTREDGDVLEKDADVGLDADGEDAAVSPPCFGTTVQRIAPGPAHSVDISDDGRLVVFGSDGALDPNDTNSAQDVYLLDRATMALQRISVASSGAQLASHSTSAAISGDGTLAAFVTAAPNVVAMDGNGAADVFVRDLRNGTVRRISVASDGSEAAGQSGTPAIDRAGTVVVFGSTAENLVANDGNGVADVFVHELATGVTTAISVTAGAQTSDGASLSPAISGDGRFVAFVSLAADLLPDTPAGQIYLYDRMLGALSVVSLDAAGRPGVLASNFPALDDDGDFVAFTSAAVLSGNDGNGSFDVYLRDRGAGETILVSTSTSGVAALGFSVHSDLSGDGQVVVFDSDAPDLVEPDVGALDVFAWSRTEGGSVRLTRDYAGPDLDVDRLYPRVDRIGCNVVFVTGASNLDPTDTDSTRDVYAACLCP